MTFWFSKKVSRIWTCVAITPDYNHVAYHDVLILRDKDFLKMTHFWVPQNSSIPREVSLETVHFLFIFLKIGPFLGPSKRFLPSWSVVRNGPKSGSFCSKRVHFWTVSNDTSRGMEPFWVTRKWSIFGSNLCNRRTDRHWTNIKFRDVTLISRTGSTIAPFGGNNTVNVKWNQLEPGYAIEDNEQLGS